VPTARWTGAGPSPLSTYDPVALELARQLAEAAGAELIGVSAGGKGVAAPIASKAALARGLARVVIVEDESLANAGRGELAAVLAAVIRHIGDVDLVITGDSSVDVAAKMVPTVLAGELGWPAVAEVAAVSGKAGALRVERAIPGGVQVLEVSGPAVLAASADARCLAWRHEGTPRGGQEAGGAPRSRRAQGAPSHAVMTVTGRSRRSARPAGPAHRHHRPGCGRRRAGHRPA